MKVHALLLSVLTLTMGHLVPHAYSQTLTSVETEDLRYNVLQAKLDILLKQYQTELNNLLACQEYAGFWDGSKCQQISCVRPNSPRGNSGVCIDGNGVSHISNGNRCGTGGGSGGGGSGDSGEHGNRSGGAGKGDFGGGDKGF